jgi:acyl transferase domain-containing protein/enoyl-CoA hydratase/carnithine racemase/acyl carrier protein/NAD(P)-dependent dehydrogenase (short-subunit alcohol dehydrogenase family)
MLKLLKFCCHGYVAMPIIESCHKQGLFTILEGDKFCKRSWLVKELKANEGYFSIALQALESLGWLEKNDKDAYRLIGRSDKDLFGLDLTSLYAIDPETLLKKATYARRLAEKIGKVLLADKMVSIHGEDLVMGAIIPPLVIGLKYLGTLSWKEGEDNFCEAIGGLDKKLVQAIEKLFISRNWLTRDKSQLTAEGRRLLHGGEFMQLLAYRPMLYGINNLLFGDSTAIHIDETLKIAASQAEGQGYFQDARQDLIDLFNQLPLDEHPQAIVDEGVMAEKEVLPIYSFSPRNLTIDTKQPVNKLLSPLVDGELEHYLDEKGQLLGALSVLSHWQRYLQLWAGHIGKSPLLLLAAHTLPAHKAFEYLDRSGNFYLDTIHCMSRQYLISAEALLILAANAGLFNRYQVKRYPELSGFCGVSLHHFTKRDYIIRFATVEDIESLVQLEELCWQEQLRTSAEQMLARIQQYPQGQFVLEKEGQVLGVIYSQRIANDAELEKYDAGNVHELHNPAGSIIQLIAVNIHPGSQNLGYGDQLLEFMLQRCSLIPGIFRVVAVSLCKKYDVNGPLSVEQYIQQKGSKQDPILAFHDAHGARIVKPMPNYRPNDHANQGYGVLVAYDILGRTAQSRHNKSAGGNGSVTGTSGATFSQSAISRFLQDKVTRLLNVDIPVSDFDRPVMEMGLNSVDLMSLQKQIEGKFNLALQPAFFFQYNSINKVISHLLSRLNGKTESDIIQPVEKEGPENSAGNKDLLDTDIAIVGISCKLPGGIESADELWNVLESAGSMIGPFPADRGEWPSGNDRPGIDQGGFLRHADAFDASFFRMSPKEAQITDPQQRMLLELTWACLEDASMVPAALKGTDIGVFIGASNCDYYRLMQANNLATQANHAVGGSLAVLANRISYFFDFNGPSLTIDTACSASLVALHTAIKSLRLSECSAALVGGVNLICYPDLSIAYQSAGMLSPDARCKVFDVKANGYVRSEGAVVLLLKPLRKAIEDNDHIHAVIKGSAVNHGGLAGGLTVPNPQKQSELYIAAWKNAGISPQELSYIEAHGTGTSLGDPIEIQGIKTAYTKLVPAEQARACAIGSVKSNLGHLESAAGITGLLKVILSMQHRQLPASINYEELNPKILLQDTPFHIQNKLQDWHAQTPLLAGVSSFGSGGANAHVVVQEYVSNAKESISIDYNLFVLSAASRERLQEYAEKVVDWSGKAAGFTNFTDAIYSWQVGRTAMKHRLAVKVKDWQDLRNKLTRWLADGNDTTDLWTGLVTQAGAGIDQQGEKLQPSGKGLEELASNWVSGIDIEWRKLYADERPERISLPVYPFARERHWIDIAERRASHKPSLVEQGPTQSEPEQVPIPPPVGKGAAYNGSGARKFTPAALEKPANVSLVAPGSLNIEELNRAAARKRSVSLSDTSDRAPEAVHTTGEITGLSLFDHGNGIYSIKIKTTTDNILSPDLIGQLLHTLEFVEQTASVRVLMLRGTGSVFLQGGREAYNEAVRQGLYRAIASFPHPVIAVMQGDAGGAGLLAGALCDFMVCSQESRYAYTNIEGGLFPTISEELLFGERFGDAFAADFLYRSAGLKGRDLKERGWSCPILPSDQVGAFAGKLASDLSAKSEDALRLLKRHLGRHILSLAEKLTVAEVIAGENGTADTCPEIISRSGNLKLEPAAGKVLTVRIGTDGKYKLKDIIEGLADVFTRVDRDRHYKSIILTSDDPGFISVPGPAASAEEVLELQNLMLGAPVPLIAAMGSGAKDLGWLIAQSCDACVYSEGSVYSAPGIAQLPELAGQAAMIFSHRLGNYVCREILLAGNEYNGVELQRSAGAVTVVGKEEALPKAMELAGYWTELPLEEVRSWKRARAAAIRKKISRLPAWLSTEEKAEAPLPGAPIAIQLRSKVIRATAHPEGIVEVKMEDREARNMFSGAFIEGITEVFGHIAQTPAYKVVILTGYDSYFSSGGTKEMLLDIQDGKIKFTDAKIYHLAMECKIPVIAAMQGHGIGAGWSMGMFADFILFSEESRYVSPYMNYGFTPGAGATLIFPDKTGYDLARETLLTAVEYAGSELREKGLLLPVLSRRNLLSAAFSLAKRIAQNPRSSLIALKHQLTAHLHDQLEETYSLELAMHEKTFVGRADTLQQIENNFYQEDAGPEMATNTYTDVLPAMLADLKTLLAQELHMREEEIDENSQFVDLGLDSIIGVTFIRKINEKYKISINATKIYSYPNLTQFSRFVKEEAEKNGTLPFQAAPEEKVLQVNKRVELQKSTAAPSALRNASSAVAVIGMAGQFPEARNVEEFWQNIAQGKNCIREIPGKRWNTDKYYQKGNAVPGKTYSKWMGALEEYDLFDPLFFNISPSEAESMDPQQRLFLQTCWHAIENAGYNAGSLAGSKCGVFVGCGQGDYHLLSRNLQLSAYGFTGGDNSILAARISYFLNLQGPCLTIDTACSSSLVAIANACDSLTLGNSDLVLAGGVYIGAGSDMHIKTSQMGMLSPDGRCYTFDQRANGFVPGEGVGVVVLKRLEDAERDGDNILGVIRGWGVNQDGKTNGITAPNTEAQWRLQEEIYNNYKIDPAAIQLVEAHGTGTKLGDPIEVEALIASFKKYTSKKQYCALGSVKSNIGHCLMAAGVAGMIKLLMSLKYKQLPPTINFEKLNEHISLDESPFYVNTELRDWKLKDTERRQAAISSFGFSGTNAHLVIAEYPAPLGTNTGVQGRVQNVDCIIPLSAKTEEQLKQKVIDLLEYIHKEGQSLDLVEMAYTLQVGRMEMGQRLGFVVSSIDQLAGKLQACIEGKQHIDNMFGGKAKNGEDTFSLFAQDLDLQKTLDRWMQEKKLANLVNVWVKGYDLDWNKLYDKVKPRRISLPLYPFAKERYWVDVEDLSRFSPADPGAAFLHPLLHRNTSILNQQRYSSIFSGGECFLIHDQLSGAKVLPGFVSLEMARAAIACSLPSQSAPGMVELHNVIWADRMIADGHTIFTISLYERENGHIEYEIYSEAANEEIIHSQGEARLSSSSLAAKIDIEQLKGQLKKVKESTVNNEIADIYEGEGQLLAGLNLSDHTVIDQSGFILLPAVMEHILQVADFIGHRHQRSVPLSLRVIRIASACTQEMFVWVRFSQGWRSADKTFRLDIDLYDKQGNLCIQMRDLSLGAGDQVSIQAPAAGNEKSTSAEVAHAEEATETLFFNEYWQEQPYTESASGDYQTIIFADRDFREKLANGTPNCLSDAIIVEQADNDQEATISQLLDQISTEEGKPVHIIYTWAKGQGETGVHMLFDLFKAIRASVSPVSRVTLAGHYTPSDVNTCWDYSWIGFERSLKLLLPDIRLSLLYTDTPFSTPQQLLDASQHNGVIWYKNGKRYVLSLQSCKPNITTGESVLRQNGNYLITGGCGSLGLKFARYLAENCNANLLLVGRRPITPDIEKQINALKAAGAREVYYHPADISDRKAVLALKSKLPFELSGIIHAAGVESTDPFYSRSRADINTVLHPKTLGAMLLDEVFDQPTLDFVCYFSSVSAVLGDFGSCDYAIASRFQMAYSQYREQKGQQHGKTMVINWPLWQDGGMRAGDTEQTLFYLKSSGQESLQTSKGIDLWHDIMRSDMVQTLVMLGKPARLDQLLRRLYQSGQQFRAEGLPVRATGMTGKGWKPQYKGLSLKECITSDLKQLVSVLTRISQNKLNNADNLTDYGFDSITLSELAKRLALHFGVEVTPAIFFSASTINKLSEHFLGEHTAHMEKFYSAAETVAVNNKRDQSIKPLLRRRAAFRENPGTAAALNQEPIAIIGMSGRFPQAQTVDQFWALLAEGKNAITEIPAGRWDWRHYFTAPGDTNNKITTNKGGFIHGVDRFDPLFFEISPREAENMDPAERLLLMETYKAIEDARISPRAIRGERIGVFVGMEEGQYDLLTGRQGITTSGAAMISSRLSYFLDFKGPVIATNTACSSGLVALHQAVSGLRLGECKAAIVAGVSLLLSPDSYVVMSEAGMLSEDGCCHSFSKNATGIGVGESVVVLMLKPLSAAMADGDPVYGVIKASGINFDGKTNGVTAPNGDRQAELIEKIYTDNRIDTGNLSYIVTHGTGTRLGDPVEINALVKAFKKLNASQQMQAEKNGHCALTSCKSNVGHTLAASGLVSVVNLLKAMQHRQIPASLNCEEENDYITWNNSPFYINKKTREWSRQSGKPFLGAVSAFGRSGTNAHVVIEEYAAPVENVQSLPVMPPDGKAIILLSARTKEQLRKRAHDLFQFISSGPRESLDLYDLSYSLQVCREEFEVRLGFLVSSITQLVEKLRAYLDGVEELEDAYQDKVKRNQEDMSIINDDDDMKEAIDRWITRRKLSKLLELWVKGLNIDWKKFYHGNEPKRIALPPYPFAEDRYWINTTADSRHLVTGTALTRHLWDETSYLAKWEEQAVLPESTDLTHKAVLVVCSGAASRLEEEILAYYERHSDSRVLLIRVAGETAQVSDKEWLCGVNDLEGFRNCLRDIDRIDTLYFLSMPEQQNDPVLLQELVNSHEGNEIQFLRLIKFLKQENKIADSVETYILTLDTLSVNEQTNHFTGAGITGLAYSLAQGNYQFQVRNLDLSSGDLTTAADRKKVLESIHREPANDRGEVFKLQSGKRYRQTLYKLNWDATGVSAIRRNGVYLIAGGSGTVGKIITRNLIEKYEATVIWLGRSVAGSAKVQSALQLFEVFGEKLFYQQVDVTDLDAMQQAVATIKDRYSTIHGAIFSGMVFDFENSLDQTTETEFRAIFDLKARGSWVFYTALKEEPLDFMCYFSSGQAYSFSGASKLSAYASGITYADSFVHSIRKQSGFPVGNINWGFWRSTSEAIAGSSEGVSTDNFDALQDAEGFKCFEQFVKELRQGRIHQVLCMKASQHIQALMNCNGGEFISLVGAQNSPSVSLSEALIEIPHEEIRFLNQVAEESEVENWLMQLLFCQIDRLIRSAGRPNSLRISELQEQCGVLSKYTPWWNACVKMLTQHGFIQWKDDIVSDWKTADSAIWKKWQFVREKYLQDPDQKARVMLVNDCLEKLPEILKGDILATDVIFPDSSMEKVEGVYKNNLLSDTFNEIVASAVVAYLQQRLQSDANARLRILEIGAGTGGTSAIVFSRLEPFRHAIEKYTYTDLSKAFFFHAEKNYIPGNPYIQCQRLDIERPVEEQGIEIGTYDLVIATNVLHATNDIRYSLRNAKAILHQNGYLLLNELSTVSLFSHLTFGLLDGWWLFKDAALRMPDSPGLYPDSWRQVLEEEGFLSVLFPAEGAHRLGQQIILARSDGAIRQKISLKEDEQKSAPDQEQAQHTVKQQRAAAVAKPSRNIQEYVGAGILHCLSETLKIASDNIDPDRAFSDYGIDSILGVSFIKQVNAALSISLNTAIIFEHSSVNRLRIHVMNAYQAQVQLNIEKQTGFSLVSNEDEQGTVNTDSLPQNRFVVGHDLSGKWNARKPEDSRSDIAVVGISGMFPKAHNINEFWDNLIQGIDGVDELPAHYLDQENYFSAKKQPGKTRCKWGGVIEDRDCFDPLFFSISPKEAASMNPHQRLVLQESWKAIEDAGYNPKDLSGSQTGVYIGAEPTGYIGESFTGYSDAIIASRLSYILNLNGPAFVVNTGCSSSAVALHLACESLRNRETDLALAGGVNACLEQNMLIRLDEIEMLSPTGRCRTFDQAANGTIMSEGIGIVVLKRLEDAVQSGDKIYGLISGSGINQDGASNGITAPNGAAQEKLIVDVYNKFGIDPEKITYVEAHGTGTKLGDPVETNALVRAFRHFTERKEFCAVGSAKSSIGHTAAAAGVIGLIRVLLSMQHNQIPKLLHFRAINPLVEFNGSPFYINTAAAEWKPLKGIPRMAAINSFGHSGTNAHLVVKEYIPPVGNRRNPAAGTNDPVIVPLSAKTPEQLQQRAVDLLAFIHGQQAGTVDLIDMAYTLQVGREAMEERLGFIVHSVEELAGKLQAYINGARTIENTWIGQARRNKDLQSLFSKDVDLQEIIDKWIARNKLASLVDLWIKGLDLDWHKLYPAARPGRLHLPSYPFAKERYWAYTSKSGELTKSPGINSGLIHPLLHKNTSDFTRQCYTTVFNGEEFFLKDHLVNGHGVLPAVAYLEMAFVAINQASPVQEGSFILELYNTAWLKPVVVAAHKEVVIALFENEGESSPARKIDFEICCAEGQDEETVHCQGQATFGKRETPAMLDVERLRGQMQRGGIKPHVIYDAFKKMGLDYGPAHQGVTAVHMGDDQLLAHLRLPPVVEAGHRDFTLHPSLMDCALQACIGLMVDLDNLPTRPLLPFALESVRVFSACTKEMFVWARYTQGTKPGDKLIKIDLDLCDRDGNICVQMHGFSSRALEGNISVTPGDTTNSRSYDDDFYDDVIEKVLNNEITADEAAALN